MAETFKELAQRQVPVTTPASVYAPAAATTAIIKGMKITNPSGAAATVRLYHHNSGGAASDATTILPAVSIPAGGWAEFDGVMVMDALDDLKCVSDTNNVLTITVYGMEIT